MRSRTVHLAGSWPDDAVERLRDRLGAAWTVTQGDRLPERAEVLVAGQPKPETLDLPGLRAVVVPFAGIPQETAAALRDRPRLQLYNLHFNADSTAEMAVALLLAAARRITLGDRWLREGRWLGRQDGSHGVNLSGKVATVYGYGAVGRQVGHVLKALGMRVLGIRRSSGAAEEDVWGAGRLREALALSHALVVTAPLTDETRGSIGSEELALLREPRLVVNVGRGPIIEEDALYEACRTGMIAGAGLDVWYRYPRSGDGPTWPSDLPFHELDNVVLSPHRAGDGDRTEEQRIEALAELLLRLEAESPVTAADPWQGY